MAPEQSPLRVTVPATSANLGAGFDVLGLALSLHNVFTIKPAEETLITTMGYGAGLPSDSSNLFYKAFSHLYELAGQQAPALHVDMDIRVPPGMGLGSSATAVVAGLVAANTMLGEPLGQAALLREAIKLEHGGHADNVAPALMGGLVVNAVDEGEVASVRVPVPAELRAVVFTPDFPMDTVQGRALMPAQYAKADVVFNTSRVGLFLAALQSGQYGRLRTAMQDRMHQPYRVKIFPLLPGLIEAALDAGAHGAALSGGGSSVIALATGNFAEIERAMLLKGREAGIKGEVRILDIDRRGALASWGTGEDGEE